MDHSLHTVLDLRRQVRIDTTLAAELSRCNRLPLVFVAVIRRPKVNMEALQLCRHERAMHRDTNDGKQGQRGYGGQRGYRRSGTHLLSDQVQRSWEMVDS
jgi:hypothetical protein